MLIVYFSLKISYYCNFFRDARLRSFNFVIFVFSKFANVASDERHREPIIWPSITGTEDRSEFDVKKSAPTDLYDC